MTKIRLLLNAVAVIAVCLIFSSLANAQASRTWVSGVGDDVNPCSRTAPCKTFSGAISKTFINGEIDALDPAGYGTVTITKSITIDGGQGSGFASILSSGVTGVNINLTDNSGNDPLKTVRLRNLSINGAGNGLIGIRILAARQVHIQNCVIFGFGGGSARGISDERSIGQLFVSDSTISDNGQSGITIVPSGTLTGTLHGTLTNVRLERNGNAGLALSKGTKASVTRSVASGNVAAGFYADGVGGASELNLTESMSVANGQGVTALSAGTVRISNMVITGNATGLNVSGASILSYGNNRIDGNAAGNGPPTGPLTDQYGTHRPAVASRGRERKKSQGTGRLLLTPGRSIRAPARLTRPGVLFYRFRACRIRNHSSSVRSARLQRQPYTFTLGPAY